MDHGHDHDHDHGGGVISGGKTCPMIMVFHAGHCERILWSGWVASTVVEFVFSALALFMLALIYEFLKFLREYLTRRAVRKEAERMAAEMAKVNGCTSSHGTGAYSNAPLAEVRERTYRDRIFSTPHLIQTLINLVQVTLGYLLMLAFMSYNYWLCLAIILGLGVGYFFFGWIKQDVYESECCH